MPAEGMRGPPMTNKYYCPPGGNYGYGNCSSGGGCSGGGYGGYRKNGYNYARNAIEYPKSFNNPYKHFNDKAKSYDYYGAAKKFQDYQKIDRYYGGNDKYYGGNDKYYGGKDKYYGGYQERMRDFKKDKYSWGNQEDFSDPYEYKGKVDGRIDEYASAVKERIPKLFISRMAFEGLQKNLSRTRFLGALLSIFSALTVGLGLASILIYNTGMYRPTDWCTNPFPRESRLVQSLMPVAPAFFYLVIISGFLGIFPLACGLMTAYLTRIYGTYANIAMYLSFISVAVLPPMFALSLVAFLMTFGENGSKPPCEALSAVSMLVVIHAVVCSLLLYIIYYTMSGFLKKLKEDPSVDYITLKKYYGKKKITVVDDGFDDGEERTRGCCDCGKNDRELSDDEDGVAPQAMPYPQPYPQPPYQYPPPQYPAYPGYGYPAPRFNPYGYMPRY